MQVTSVELRACVSVRYPMLARGVKKGVPSGGILVIIPVHNEVDIRLWKLDKLMELAKQNSSRNFGLLDG